MDRPSRTPRPQQTERMGLATRYMARTCELTADRMAPPGLILRDGEFEVLLPNKFVPEGTEIGSALEVFVYSDSEDRPVATTQRPLAEADQFVALEVNAIASAGVFLDWGLDKDLLLPYGNQARRLRRVGERVVVYVYCDEVSCRPVASTRFARHFSPTPEDLQPGQPVELLPYERTDLGVNVVVNRSFRGLYYIPPGEDGPALAESIPGYVQQLRPDGRVDLTLQPVGLLGAHEARSTLLDAIQRAGGELALGDKSPPEEIRAKLGLSKKAFKKALGALYREKKVELSDTSVRLVVPDSPDSQKPT